MKTYIILFLMMLNVSCASLMNPQEQSVQSINSTLNIYMTTCSGVAETIGTCHQKARRTCKSGYEVLDEKLDNSGVHREIKFKCK
jgi:hypothetical protein